MKIYSSKLILYICIYICLILIVLLVTCGGEMKTHGRFRIIEPLREMKDNERFFWYETINCLTSKGMLDENQSEGLFEPQIAITKGKMEPCGDTTGNIWGCTTVGCNIYLDEELGQNDFMYIHEFTHCIEWQITGHLASQHETQWWRNKHESICN